MRQSIASWLLGAATALLLTGCHVPKRASNESQPPPQVPAKPPIPERYEIRVFDGLASNTVDSVVRTALSELGTRADPDRFSVITVDAVTNKLHQPQIRVMPANPYGGYKVMLTNSDSGWRVSSVRPFLY